MTARAPCVARSRRRAPAAASLFRGAAVGAAGVAGAAVLGGGLAVPAEAHGGRGGGHGRRRTVPARRDQHPAVHPACGDDTPAGVDLVLTRLAQYGYEKVELAGLYGRTASAMRARARDLGIRRRRATTASAPTRPPCTKCENALILSDRKSWPSTH